jgi:hypothetical protein
VASQELTFDLVLETNKAVGEIKSMLAKSNAEASKAGANSGKNFGSTFKSALTTTISGISFNFLTNQIKGLFGLFSTFSNSNMQLEGAIKSVNSAELTRTSILKDSTKSIEQKAMAIGLDTADIYENSKATKSNEGAIKSLEAQIKRKERALKDETNALEQNISSIESKRDLEIQSLKNQKGFNTLSQEDQALEKDITQLELQRLQAIKTGNAVQVAQLDTILSAKKLDQDIAQKKLDLIDQETGKIEDLYKVQIIQLRSQMEASKNRFDIDIEPAKRKLEDLQATSVSVGGGQVLKKGILDQINAAAKEAPKALKQSDFTALQDELFKKYKGIIPKQSLTSAIADLVKGGLTDVGQVGKTIERFVDISAAGKVEAISMGSAVEQLGEQFRSERAALGETAGLTEEYISQLLPRGLALLQSEGKLRGKNVENLNKEERALAKQMGLLDMTADRQGRFTDKLESGMLSADETRAEFEKMALTLSLTLGPILLQVARDLLPILKNITDFVAQNPEFVSNILLAVTGFGGLLTVVSGLMTIWTVFAPLIAMLAPVFTVLAGPIGWVVAGVALLTAGLIWAYVNVESFRNMVNDAFKKIVGYVLWAKDNWLQALGQIIGFFTTLPLKLGLFIAQAVMGVYNYLRDFDWSKAWEGIKDAAGKAWEGIKAFFSGDNLKKMGNGFMDFIKGLLQGLASGIPGADKLVNPLIDKLPRFATGGQFMVGGQGGVDKNLVQFMATKGERVTIETPSQQTDNRQINSGNTTQYIYQEQYKQPSFSNLAYNY